MQNQTQTPQEILSAAQSADNAGVQPCYSPSDNHTVNWISQDGMSCTYQQHTMIAPTGYQFQCARPSSTTIIRDGNNIGPIRLVPAYQQPTAPTPPTQMPSPNNNIYSPPPPPANHQLPPHQNSIYQHRQQQSYHPYPQMTPQGSYQQTFPNQRTPTYQPTINNQNLQPLPIYLTTYNSGFGGVRTQLQQHVLGRQQYLTTAPTSTPLPPPASVRSTSRPVSNQPRTYTRRNANSSLSTLLSTPGLNVDPDDQSRNTKPIPYTPKHPKDAEIAAQQAAATANSDPTVMSPNQCCSVPNASTNISHPQAPSLTSVPPSTVVQNSDPTGNGCGQCTNIPPATSINQCNVSAPQATRPQSVPALNVRVPIVPVSRPPAALVYNRRPQNSSTQSTPTNQTPVSVSSTTRIPTVPSTSTASIQAEPETANKACQFVSDKKVCQDASISAIADTQDFGCQTEALEPLEQPVKKTYVDRASSPIIFPVFDLNSQIRRKVTAKRKPPREPSPSPPPSVAVNGRDSSDSEIDIIE